MIAIANILGRGKKRGCSILKKAVFNLTTINGVWTDSISGNDFDLGNSLAFEFDGVTNFIDTLQKVQGQTRIYKRFILESKKVGVDFVLFFSGANADTKKGLLFYIATDGTIRIYTSNGISRSFVSTSGLKILPNIVYDIEFDWTGFVASPCSLTINGVTEILTLDYEWLGESSSNLILFSYTPQPSIPFYGIVASIECVINGEENEIPFSVGDLKKVYNVNNEVELNISGIGGAWVLRDWTKNYNLLNGFSKVGNSYIPASKLNVGFDVLGNALTNPATGEGHNGAETELLPPNIAAWKLIDTENKLFDVGGNPIAKSFADMEANVGNYLFCNIVNSTNDKRQYVMFYPPLTTEEQTTLLKCYAKTAICLIGAFAFCEPLNSQYLPLIF